VRTRARTLFIAVGITGILAAGVMLLLAPPAGSAFPRDANQPDSALNAPETVSGPVRSEPVPARKDYADFASWYVALCDHSDALVKGLAGDASRQTKMLRSATVIDVLSREAKNAADPVQRAQIEALAARHRVVLASLADPQETIDAARAEAEREDWARACGLLKLVADNPNYDCPDVELLLSYWQVLNGNGKEAVQRFRKLAARKDYAHRDLAAFLISWSHTQQGRMFDARRELESFLTDFPQSEHAGLARKLLDRIPPTTKPG
jgi:hypothetical protein